MSNLQNKDLQNTTAPIGIIAGKGVYPALFIDAAKKQAPDAPLIVAGFHGETAENLKDSVTAFEWFRVGQLGKVIKFFKKNKVKHCVMMGQISPRNLFDLVPDVRTMMMLAKLKEKNADTLFKGITEELAKDEIEVLLATTFLEDLLAAEGHVCGPPLKKKFERDANYGFSIAKETSRLDIGQSVVVRDGTVLAVEAFEGTNSCIKRGGEQGRGKACTLAKVTKPNHDFRFDVPCLGDQTIKNCHQAGVQVIACEANKTLLLEKEKIEQLCQQYGITIIGIVH